MLCAAGPGIIRLWLWSGSLHAGPAFSMGSIGVRGAYVKMLAERRCGELLREMAEKGERATDGKPSHDVMVLPPPTLADLDIAPMQSSRWQKVAAVPEALRADSGRFQRPSVSGYTGTGARRDKKAPGVPSMKLATLAGSRWLSPELSPTLRPQIRQWKTSSSSGYAPRPPQCAQGAVVVAS